MICEGYRTHRGVTGPMNFKSRTFFFLENRAPGVLGHLAAIKALYLTLQTLLGLVKIPWKPYACFQRATELREVSLVR